MANHLGPQEISDNYRDAFGNASSSLAEYFGH